MSLFSRGRQDASPTPVGEQVIAYARQVLQLLEEMLQAAKLEKSLPDRHQFLQHNRFCNTTELIMNQTRHYLETLRAFPLTLEQSHLTSTVIGNPFLGRVLNL